MRRFNDNIIKQSKPAFLPVKSLKKGGRASAISCVALYDSYREDIWHGSTYRKNIDYQVQLGNPGPVANFKCFVNIKMLTLARDKLEH